MARKLKNLILIFLFLSLPLTAQATDYTQDANCASAWLMDEDTGTTLTDSSVNENTATFAGGEPAWDSGDDPAAYTSTSLLFVSGNAEYCTTGDVLNKPFSYIVWVKVEDTASVRTIFAGGNNSIQFRVEVSEALGLIKAAVLAVAESDTAIATGTWVHTALSYDNSGNYVFYGDGIDIGNGTNDQTWDGGTDRIGRRDTAEYFDGNMVELAFFDDVLTSTEINDIMDNGLAPTAAEFIPKVWMM